MSLLHASVSLGFILHHTQVHPVMQSHRQESVMQSHRQESTDIWKDPPYLAVLTEPDACRSVNRLEETYNSIERATCDGNVDLVIVRTSDELPISGEMESNKLELLKRLSQLKLDREADGMGFKLVVNNDLDIAITAMHQNVTIDGMHVKERNIESISTIRQQLQDALMSSGAKHNRIIMGTSCHSIESAMTSYEQIDYLFVGTCYMTKSHPEKNQDQLEGPQFPGRIKEELNRLCVDIPSPIIFALGGIDETNCHEPVLFGADGVGVIRSVMQAVDPQASAAFMCKSMLSAGSTIDEPKLK